MENLDFSSTDVGQIIQPKNETFVLEEKKEDIQQMNMMEFSSSLDDLMPADQPPTDTDQYTNPTSGRVTGLSLPTPEKKPQPKKQNPFNLTDDQYDAVIAGVIGAIVYSVSIQTKLSGMVPNFNGMNGSIASAILIALLFFLFKKYVVKKS
jgi:hypothetical protein